MENRGLLFIPDISGFTRFVNETEIDHSRLIIQELLELLVDSNEIGMEISEIEGDAILFYKYGACPDLQNLYKLFERQLLMRVRPQGCLAHLVQELAERRVAAEVGPQQQHVD